jgi:hypothetical protein
MQRGGYFDPDARVKVTIARDARGVPARVVDVELSNIDSRCHQFDPATNTYTSEPGPQVSASLGSFALTRRTKQHANYSSTVFEFDPFAPTRTIDGSRYRLTFSMEEDDDAGEAQLSVDVDDPAGYQGRCEIAINGYNDRLTDGTCRMAQQAAESGDCSVAGGTLDQAYKQGLALYFDCGASFACPAAQDVDVEATVIKSVAKALGLPSRTVAGGNATGPKQAKVDGRRGTYYFVPLRADVVRRMKAKKVRSMTVTVSGTATGADGVRRFAPKRIEWFTNANCSGLDLKMQRHLVYGGKCIRN